MIRNVFSAALVSAAVIVAGPALAKPGGGGGLGGGMSIGAGIGANVNPNGHGVGASAHGNVQAGTSSHGGGMSDIQTGSHLSPDLLSGQGTMRASTNAVGKANVNSALGRNGVLSSSLTGLTIGTAVQTSGGANIGTVSRVVTDSRGNVRLVLVTSPTGQTLRLGPSALTMNGDVLVAGTNTNANVGIRAVNSQGLFNASPTGIAHASPNSVLARGALAGNAQAIAGLGLNMAVQNANGTTIGNISRIVTDRSGNVRLVIVTNSSTGATFRLAPSTLTVNGTTLVTTSTVGG